VRILSRLASIREPWLGLCNNGISSTPAIFREEARELLQDDRLTQPTALANGCFAKPVNVGAEKDAMCVVEGLDRTCEVCFWRGIQPTPAVLSPPLHSAFLGKTNKNRKNQ
jgi:hypothetical protein